ncbi:type I glutamate--ammonia ligase [Candidatus Liberibacter americanus]|uniref:type I glutamate--ammonia ligase n=1 Tax=Candidatus Liberibacter americanus TaxID=309868 RepID=UPI00165159FC|nr:type I glutamate--ammonia ligase [Candidatus Liberibacter americanus]
MDEANKIIQKIKQEDIKFVDFRFTDLKGKFHHISMDSFLISAELLLNGILFDASSIEGWKSVKLSNLVLMPDLKTMHIDPFYAQSTMVLICDIYDSINNKPYSKDPRHIAKKAIEYLKNTKIGDKILLEMETEFFIFDSVNFKVLPEEAGFALESSEFPLIGLNIERNTGNNIDRNNGGYTLPPQDRLHDMRSEIVTSLKNMGVIVTKYHHKENPAQHVMSLQFDTLLHSSDNIQKYKYAVRQVADSYCKTASFMPKPTNSNNGSGIHLNMSIHKNEIPIFAGDAYEGFSNNCLYYIGGIIKHSKAINALTNSSTNSYRRLLYFNDSQIQLGYPNNNRSVSFRIPFDKKISDKQINIRFPDLTSNPYLAPIAILMAGLDGIKNQINPRKNIKNTSKIYQKELIKSPKMCNSLRESLENLDKDRDFLKEGNVFDDDLIDSFIEFKMKEVMRLEKSPSPIEFEMYYSI